MLLVLFGHTKGFGKMKTDMYYLMKILTLAIAVHDYMFLFLLVMTVLSMEQQSEFNCYCVIFRAT